MIHKRQHLNKTIIIYENATACNQEETSTRDTTRTWPEVGIGELPPKTADEESRHLSLSGIYTSGLRTFTFCDIRQV